MPHVHDTIDFTVEVMIVHNNKVLLRKHDKYHMWLSVGGHIELDEDPIEAATREVKEEVGLDIQLIGESRSADEVGYTELMPPRFMNRNRISDTHEHVTLTYFARSDSDVVRQGDTEKSDEVRWFTADQLDEPGYGIREHIKYYARAALRAATE